MGADGLAQSVGRVPAVVKRSVAALSAERRRFWIGLACAAVLHAALIFGISRSSPPHVMGEREGRPDGISVILVDAADLDSRDTAPPPVDSSPPGPDSAAQPSKPSQAIQPAPAPAPAPKETTAREVEREKTDALPLPDLPGKESGTAPPTKSPPKPKPAPKPQLDPPLQLSMPDMAFPAVGRSAAVSRPPGVTRSGENDDFARGVIRALRQTMPAPTGTLGRVTVRLYLTDNGNLQEVFLVRGADDAMLTQSVVFAVKQASFPIPPAGSTPVDRTFLVTYIYR